MRRGVDGADAFHALKRRPLAVGAVRGTAPLRFAVSSARVRSRAKPACRRLALASSGRSSSPRNDSRWPITVRRARARAARRGPRAGAGFRRRVRAAPRDCSPDLLGVDLDRLRDRRVARIRSASRLSAARLDASAAGMGSAGVSGDVSSLRFPVSCFEDLLDRSWLQARFRQLAPPG